MTDNPAWDDYRESLRRDKAINGTTEEACRQHTAKALQEAAARIEQIHRMGGVVGLTTGLPSLDRATLGLEGQRLYVLGGRPGAGKSALAIQIACHAARAGNRVVYWSLEMTATQNLMRQMLAVSRWKIEDSFTDAPMPDSVWLEIDRFIVDAERNNTLPLFVPLSDATPRIVRSVTESLFPDLVVVDNLALVESEAGDRDQFHAVSRASRAFKRLCNDLNVPVLLVAQLSRAVESREDRRPHIADLRGSGSIEQDADVVMLLYRREMYGRSEVQKKGYEPEDRRAARQYEADLEYNKWRGKAEIIIGKHRDYRPAVLTLGYDAPAFRFHELEAL